ncbi:MAG: hypothetical protein BRC51_11740 [Cyanobacteria bacterium SW_12_48_29]|nr:MAG: hypothetical protein BRC51_11740 [Cyanobacteria bacterium SW_12_48_29]PSP11727.1 MAG: hypothetical protein BRC50_10980 [Cyanobacteria bacterium SW_11_48_12]PSP12261.1 MAG: hypothetical protein BRC49_05710 [Cyanobacteria bacterium SW_10_48_33]PSP20796.1 MAG: hypothetical protein BRC52_07830 [Cyanobacteria bacterium SW_5_48_44]
MHSLAWVNLAVPKVGEQRGRGAEGLQEQGRKKTRRRGDTRKKDARPRGHGDNFRYTTTLKDTGG